DAVFAVPAYGPQNDVTLKMPAFEWVHVQLHQQKGMISLSPPTICNSADRREAPAGDIMDHIAAFFDARIAALTGAGIKRNRLVLDPGMGFFLGAAPETSLSVLARFDELRLRFDLPVLLSVSRKSFLRALTGRGPGDVGAATLAAELAAAAGGADFIRTHEPRPLRDGLAVLAALKETARIR
ncbi:dihydropteroate synthase, partial [Escherichia coli]|uniref:dihydropteroate synthase n=1 Tax=Escherichia coli TaxID=562 RepID=UPI003D9CA365